MLPKLITMVGLPGSGKSYEAERIAQEEKATIISSDAIREELFSDVNNQSNNALVFNTLYRRVREYLIENRNVVIDATNTTLKSRSRIMREISGIKCEKICYVLTTTVEECIRRDRERERNVGEEVIHKFEMSYQCPQYFEGWDKIILVGETSSFDSREYQKLKDRMNVFNQYNPHHIFTVGVHCDKTAEFLPLGSVEREAARLHDVGKLFTQSFDNAGIAHYYNHDSIGTYYLLSHNELIPIKDNILEFLFFINYHMRAHNDIAENTKAGNKYKEIFEERLYNRLMRFAKADRMANGTSRER